MTTIQHDPTEAPSIRQALLLPDYLTIDELAEYLQVSKHTIYHWRQQGNGPSAVQFGKHLRFAREVVVRWAQDGGDR